MEKKQYTMHANRNQRVFAAALLGTLAVAGCAHLGPGSVVADRFDYSTAIAESWKEQTLLNIVKLRYMDLPVFVDVSSIVAGYSLQAGVNITGVASSDRAVQGNYLSANGLAIYTDRPTITYSPLTGEKFMRGLLTPIDPKNIFALLQSGYPADFILALTVESLNGVRNRSAAAGVVREADPEFLRVLELLREVQAAGAVGMRVEGEKGKGQTAVLLFRRDNVPADIIQKQAEIRQLLNLPDQAKYVLSYSPVRGSPGVLAVASRSMLQILNAFASYVEIPEAHLKDHSATPAIQSPGNEGQLDAMRIHSGTQKPARAYAAVRYREHWFWIDDDDLRTKRAMSSIVFCFTLAETGGSENIPLITIPAQ
ncbi:MAG: hypothetical protein ABFC67_10140 [Mizugakiibacter sp.]|uniref:hypothetical protein n=1 Tax=Mizugakiibacter sp. TaxID=1972610 RepID=UPI0031C20043|nr:hypothetical protein [Xanthomonadaceae bacterium]